MTALSLRPGYKSFSIDEREQLIWFATYTATFISAWLNATNGNIFSIISM